MGLTDKLKDLQKQAQGVVAEHKDNIQNAVGSVGSAANEKTHGKYADKITRVGDKLNATVEKLGGTAGEGGTEAEAANGQAAGTAEPEATAEPAEAAQAESAEKKSDGDAPEFE